MTGLLGTRTIWVGFGKVSVVLSRLIKGVRD